MTPSSPGPTPAEAVDPGRVPPAARGATRIADRVVVTIAARAAREALHGGPGADVLPRGARTAPRAVVQVRQGSGRGEDRSEARISLGLELGYPSDVGAQCRAVRRHVGERVRELTGMDVVHVGIEVHRLHAPAAAGGPTGRVA